MVYIVPTCLSRVALYESVLCFKTVITLETDLNDITKIAKWNLNDRNIKNGTAISEPLNCCRQHTHNLVFVCLCTSLDCWHS